MGLRKGIGDGSYCDTRAVARESLAQSKLGHGPSRSSPSRSTTPSPPQRAGADRLELGFRPFARRTDAFPRNPGGGPSEVLPAGRRDASSQVWSGFGYSEGELGAMERDGERFLAAGAQGLVFGALDEEGIASANTRLVRLGGEAVFHRAFDTLPEPLDALERLIDLGFRRVLTSGGRGTAPEGAETIRRLIERADGRIEVLPGGGVRPDNLAALVARTGATQVHLAGQEWVEDPTAAGMTFNGPAHPEGRFGRVSEAVVRALRDEIRPSPLSPGGERGSF